MVPNKVRSLQDIPKEIIRLILLCLPVKSLLNLRCVSKSWCSFVNLHLKRRIVFLPFSKERLVNNEVRFLSPDDGCAPVEKPSLDDSLLNEFNYSARIFGFCNGFICLILDMDRLALWNPSTSEFKILPKPSNIFHGGVFYGMGYDSSIDDYKLVRAAASRFKDEDHGLVRVDSPIKFEVLTGKSNSWRRIRDMGTLQCCIQKQAVHLRGSLHWLMQMFSSSDQGDVVYKDNVILSLNLADEKLQEICPPDEGWIIRQSRLGVLGDSLCVCSYDGSCVRLWIMREYNMKASWTKVITMTMPTFSYYAMPICISRNGEVAMLVDGKDLVMYNLKEHSYRRVVIGDSINSFNAAFYVESLIRLHDE